MLPRGGTVAAFCGRILALGRGNLQMPGGSPGLAPRDGHWWVHNRPFQFKKCTAVSLAIPSSSHLLGTSFTPKGRKLPSHVCEKKSHAQLKYLSCYRLNCYLLKGHENDRQKKRTCKWRHSFPNSPIFKTKVRPLRLYVCQTHPGNVTILSLWSWKILPLLG